MAPDEPTHVPDHAGEDYLNVLERVHDVLRPRTYLEIGTWTGNSLQLANCPAIAIDPRFQITSDVIGKKPQCSFFQKSSDAFFRDHSPRQILGDQLDLVFLDGMHFFEFLLRDFTNVEPHCARNSIVIMHDCIPTDVYIAGRVKSEESQRLSTKPGWWAGDVWKMLLILRKYRPDLTVVCVDAPPTGLVLITGLYPDSRILRDRYQDIVAEFNDLTLAEYGLQAFLSHLNIGSTRSLSGLHGFGPTFWL
jgi:hypothetical protein